MSDGRDWLSMKPSDFDTEADDAELALFELTVDQVAAPVDGHGTGDLFEEVDGD